MIVDLQRRLAEVGRIRIGQQVPIGKSGKTRPAKLDTFRLTSPDRQRIEYAAQLYGGTVEAWDAPAGQQWQVITNTDRLAVMVPPSDLAFTQWFEMWSGGGCQRRCDGRTESITDAACLCDPDTRECDVHTRLSVMLRDLVGLGLWRLDTQGWNAALELQGAVEVMQLAAGRGQMLPAQLRLEQRMTKRPGQQTRRFAVPVLDVEISPAQLLGGQQPRAIIDETPRAINGTAALTPVPETVPQWPTESIAEQAKPPEPKPRRRGTQTMPATGLLPRTAEEFHADIADTTVIELVGTEPPEDVPPIEDGPPLIPGTEDGPQWSGRGPDEPQLVDNVVGVTITEHYEGTDHPGVLPADPRDDVRLITPAQLKKLAILLREAGFDDRETRHAFVSTAINRSISTAKDLTLDEAMLVIDILENNRIR